MVFVQGLLMESIFWFIRHIPKKPIFIFHPSELIGENWLLFIILSL